MIFQNKPATPTAGYTRQDEVLRASRAIETGRVEPTNLGALTDSVGGILRDYPGPSLLIGAGLAWLLVSREQKYSKPLPARLRANVRQGRQQIAGAAVDAKDSVLDAASGAREQIQGKAADVKDQALEGLEHAKESLENIKLQAGERVDSVKASALDGLDSAKTQALESYENAKLSAQEGLETARHTYEDILEENPLVIGAVAIAAGIAFGLLLPSTHKEDELMGPTRDSLLDQARSIVDDARRTAVDSLRAGAESVKGHLSEAAAEAKSHLAEAAAEAKGHLADAATEAKEAVNNSLANTKDVVKQDLNVVKDELKVTPGQAGNQQAGNQQAGNQQPIKQPAPVESRKDFGR